MAETLRVELGKMRISGNQAIARGAIEAGVRVTCAYPGAPISDLQHTFESLAKKPGYPRNNPFTIKLGEALDKAGYELVAKWGEMTNEPNALSFALGNIICKGDKKPREYITPEEYDVIYGETIFAKQKILTSDEIPAGSRVMCSVKHLGGNTAADVARTLMNIIPYPGGLAIASGDDRQGTASQTMQDNKVLFAWHFRMPTFEVHNPANAHITVRNAYKLCEELGVPFAIVENYNQSYRGVAADVTLEIDTQANKRKKGFTPDPYNLVTIGPQIRPKEKRHWERIIPLMKKKFSDYFEFLNNEVVRYSENPTKLVIVNGPFREDFNYIRSSEAREGEFKRAYKNPVVIASDLVWPLPSELYKKIFEESSIEEVYVFEEGYGRVMYFETLDFINTYEFSARVRNKGIPYEPRMYERFSYAGHIMASAS
jgi:TPP-dependent indolepyruvate ferredoxin oxidoreductase alpha subunit